jgi:hypothetical protein
VPTIVGEPGQNSCAGDVAAAAAAVAAACTAGGDAVLAAWELKLVMELCDEVGGPACTRPAKGQPAVAYHFGTCPGAHCKARSGAVAWHEYERSGKVSAGAAPHSTLLKGWLLCRSVC